MIWGVIPWLLIILLFKSQDAWNQNPFANILLEFYGWGPRTNVNWISSLSDSDRLEIQLTFVLGHCKGVGGRKYKLGCPSFFVIVNRKKLEKMCRGERAFFFRKYSGALTFFLVIHQEKSRCPSSLFSLVLTVVGLFFPSLTTAALFHDFHHFHQLPFPTTSRIKNLGSSWIA